MSVVINIKASNSDVDGLFKIETSLLRTPLTDAVEGIIQVECRFTDYDSIINDMYLGGVSKKILNPDLSSITLGGKPVLGFKDQSNILLEVREILVGISTFLVAPYEVGAVIAQGDSSNNVLALRVTQSNKLFVSESNDIVPEILPICCSVIKVNV
jgi:hypothetical protein